MANVTVAFGSDTRSNNAITAGWIQGAMHAQEQAGDPVCAVVRVEGGDINVTLFVGSCRTGGGGGGGRRPPNAAESEVFALQHKLHLDQPRFSPGELEALVKQAMRL